MAGIYIHIPYCKQKCCYCNFHFRTTHADKPEMLQSIKKEIKLRKSYLGENIINSIYFGGGTPSIINTKEISSLIKQIENNFIIDNNAEITLECNPEDLTQEMLNNLKKTRINRLSIGVQSFDDKDLIFMNRSHNSEQAIKCISLAQKIGFKNISIDLIYGIPKQTNEKWEENLTKMLDLNIQHFSAYALTIEPKTKLAHLIKTKKIKELSETKIIDQFNKLIDVAEKNNFIHYEISNFGKEGFFSNHNTSYWENKHYLGVGPSAHSFNGESRTWNISSNKKYISGVLNNTGYSETEILSTEQKYNEYILTNLRTIWGVNLDYIKKQFNIDILNHFKSHIQKWEIEKKIEKYKNSYTLTRQGKLYADAISSNLFII